MKGKPLTVLGVHPGNVVNGGLLGCLEIADFLKKSGHNFILATDGEGEATSLAKGQGLQVISTKIPRWFCGFRGQSGKPDPRMIWKFLKNYRQGVDDLARHIQAEKVDVVLANTSPAIVGVLAANKVQCPVLCHIRETMPDQSRWGRAHARFLARRTERIIVNSESSARPFLRFRNWAKIYDGLDSPTKIPTSQDVATWKKSLNIDEGRPVVGILGGVSPIKGHFLFLDILPRLVKQLPNILVVFMGSKPPAKKTSGLRGAVRAFVTGQNLNVDEIISKAGIQHNVLFPGWLDDPFCALAGIDVLAFPSIIAEGFGRPLVEAALMHKPVVAFGHGPSPEIVESGTTGILVPSGNPNEFADALAKLLLDRDLANTMGAQGYQKVVRDFPLKKHMERVLSELQSVATMQGKSGLASDDGVYGLILGGDTGNAPVESEIH